MYLVGGWVVVDDLAHVCLDGWKTVGCRVSGKRVGKGWQGRWAGLLGRGLYWLMCVGWGSWSMMVTRGVV